MFTLLAVLASWLDEVLDLNMWEMDTISAISHVTSNAITIFPNQPSRPDQIAAIFTKADSILICDVSHYGT